MLVEFHLRGAMPVEDFMRMAGFQVQPDGTWRIEPGKHDVYREAQDALWVRMSGCGVDAVELDITHFDFEVRSYV